MTEYKKININLYTPRDNAKVKHCHWCGGGFTKDHYREELISRTGHYAISVGIICNWCMQSLVMLGEDEKSLADLKHERRRVDRMREEWREELKKQTDESAAHAAPKVQRTYL